jgi:hypothetical protein
VSTNDLRPVEPWEDDVNAPFEAEIGLLGAALTDDSGEAAKILFGIPVELFSNTMTAKLALAMPSAMNGHACPDIIALAAVVRERGDEGVLAFLRDKLFNWPTGANAALYADRIRFFANRRRERDLRSALRSATNGPQQDRAKAALDGFLALVEEEKQAAKPILQSAWDVADLRREPAEPEAVQFVSRLFVRPSFNIVFGPAQAGKSWAIMGLCIDAVTGGGNFLGCQDLPILPLRAFRDGERDERCLWVFGSEDTRGRVRRRAETLLEGRDLPNGRFVIATPPGGISIHMDAGWAWLMEQVERHQPTIVVLDTIASLTGHTLDVNDGAEVIPFIGKINALRAERELVIFALHHTRKGGTDAKRSAGDKADAMLGSGAWRSLSEGVLMLDCQDGDTSDIRVRSIKAKDIANPFPPFRACLESPAGRFRVLFDEEVAPAREAVLPRNPGGRPVKFSADAVLALRKKFPDGIGWNESLVADALDFGHATWVDRRDEVANELLRRGCVFISGSLRWPSP